jgi:hypothetical protein
MNCVLLTYVNGNKNSGKQLNKNEKVEIQVYLSSPARRIEARVKYSIIVARKIN